MNIHFYEYSLLIVIKQQSMGSILESKTNTEYLTFRSCFVIGKFIIHVCKIYVCIFFSFDIYNTANG